MTPKSQKAIDSLLQHGYECDIDPPYEGGIEGFITELKGLFATYFDPGYVEAEFALPPDLIDFLQAIEGSYFKSNWAGLYAMEGIFTSTQYELELWDPETEGQMIWISIGHWSDKHQLLMCLNKSSAYFGKVIDAHDNHPYCSDSFDPDDKWDGIFSYTSDPE